VDGRFTTNVFAGGTGGSHTDGVSSLRVTPGGSLPAVREGRRAGPAADGDIDPLTRRSDDGGRIRAPTSLVSEEGGTRPATIGNRCPVVDATTGTGRLTFCREPRDKRNPGHGS
jgi:hypothetical protein